MFKFLILSSTSIYNFTLIEILRREVRNLLMHTVLFIKHKLVFFILKGTKSLKHTTVIFNQICNSLVHHKCRRQLLVVAHHNCELWIRLKCNQCLWFCALASLIKNQVVYLKKLCGITQAKLNSCEYHSSWLQDFVFNSF